ncbi:MAG TPA: carboxylesterase family protein [bacterium]|nr:carboxylesterase family protein [bacterium]
MEKIRNLFIRSITFAVVALVLAATAAQAGPCDNISTASGPVSGTLLEKAGVCAYLGVPYAAPPVGDLRFRMPVEHDPWTEPLAADSISPQCPQVLTPMSDSEIPMDEDCLYMNIWQPVSEGGPKPVMVFVHGGGFIIGTGGSSMYEGSTLARYGDVVVVNFNYRLGVFGFLAHPSLRTPDGISGNWGMYDQVAALEWVKKNISSFGGDPDNVTLFGQSAGGMSVGLHLSSPLSAGLFKNVMILSGPVLLINSGMEKAEKSGLKLAGYLGCDDPDTAAECLRNVDVDKIMNDLKLGIFVLDNAEADNMFFLAPVIDGKFMPDAPYKIFRDGKFNTDVNVVLGTTRDEAAYFTMNKTLREDADFLLNYEADMVSMETSFSIDLRVDPEKVNEMYPLSEYPSVEKAYQDLICDAGFTCATELLGELIVKYQPNVYRFYHTKDPIKIMNWGAYHGSELPYIFGNFKMMGRDFKSKTNMKLTQKVITLWSAYAKTGTMKADGLTDWPLYDLKNRSYMILGNDLEVGTNLKREKCAVMESEIKEFFDN